MAVLVCSAAPVSARDTVPAAGDLAQPIFRIRERRARSGTPRGLLLLHSFEYEAARKSFQRPREPTRDRDGLLGEALTYNHPLWGEQDLAAARSALARLAPTPRNAQPRHRRARAGLPGIAEKLYGTATRYGAMRTIVRR